MGYREYQAKTLEEAITAASIDLGVISADLYYDVVDRGSNGILGFGKRDFTIRACKLSEKEENDKQEVKQEESVDSVKKSKKGKADEDAIKKVAEDFLKEVLSAMDLDVEIKVDYLYDEGHNNLNIDISGENMAIIIGKRGQTLDSLQYLVNLAVNKNSDAYVRVKLDTEDYRRRREETLVNLAKNISSKVKKTGKSIKLEPMNPYERRTIHYALQEDKGVTTLSEGDGSYRHVIVKPSKQ